MSNTFLRTTEGDLKKIADAIRQKRCTNKPFLYPYDFVTGIREIGGKTIYGDEVIDVDDASNGHVCSVVRYGVCEQDEQTGDIICNNGVVRESGGGITVIRKNLYDSALKTDGYYIKPSGDLDTDITSFYSGAIPVVYGRTYTLSGVSGKSGSNNKRIVMFSNSGVPSSSIKVGTPSVVSVTGVGEPYQVSITIDNDSAAYIRFSINTADTNVSVTELKTETGKETVSIESSRLSKQDAIVENLFGVGYVRDEQELTSGKITRRNSVCVYDGTQSIGDRFLSSTGGKDVGAIIVYPMEREYSSTVVSINENANNDLNMMKIRVTPKQDLNGFSYPWPGGAGKNLLNGSVNTEVGTCVYFNHTGTTSEKTTTLNPGTYTISVSYMGLVKAHINVYKVSPYEQIAVAYNADSLTFTLEDTEDVLIWLQNSAFSAEEIGTIQLEAGSSVTSYEPYANICKIDGFTGVGAHITGKDIITDGVDEDNGYLPNRYLINDGTAVFDSNQSQWYVSEYFVIMPSTDYVLSASENNAASPCLCWYDVNRNFLDSVQYNQRTIISCRSPEHAAFCRVSVNKSANFQLEAGVSATQYEQYTGSSYKTSWGHMAGVVYGCTVDIVTGSLIVNKASIYLDSNSVYDSCTADPSGAYARITSSVGMAKYTPSVVSCLSDSIAGVSYEDRDITADRYRCYVDNSGSVVVRFPNTKSDADAADFKSSFSGMTIIYELSTPLSYQLDQQQISTLIGKNNIWSDDGFEIVLAVSDAVTEYAQPQDLILSDGINTIFSTGSDISNVPFRLIYNQRATKKNVSDVNFIDFDGEIVYSYTASEFKSLTRMPSNPYHDGLISLGWNWSLADAKTYIDDVGQLWIGQNYITSDGKTRIHIYLSDGRLEPLLRLRLSGGAVSVDWGDGTEHSILDAPPGDATMCSASHKYRKSGQYTISLSVSGSVELFGDSSIGSNLLIKSDIASAYENRCYQNAIKRIEIGLGVSVGEYAFAGCASLSSVVLSSQSLHNSLPDQVFSGCDSIKAIIIPAIQSEHPEIGDGAFYGCYAMRYLAMPKSIYSIGQNAFLNCGTITSISVPDGVTSIGAGAFDNCASISTLYIPDSVTEIYGNALANCGGLARIRFAGETPPYMGAVPSIPYDCFICVPFSALAAYLSASNYPSRVVCAYAGYATYAQGAPLPERDDSSMFGITWYASLEDALAKENEITEGNGAEVYGVHSYTGTIEDSWDDIFASESDGTYLSKYSVGDTKMLSLSDGRKIEMQIAAFDVDSLYDNSGNAKITWISKNVIGPSSMFTDTQVNDGWANSIVRLWLRTIVFSYLPLDIQEAIQLVSKTFRDESGSTNTIGDTLWVPSARELNYSQSVEAPVEGSGAIYQALFANDQSRRKFTIGSLTPRGWWTRTAFDDTHLVSVATTGSYTQTLASASIYVSVGFCT